MPLNFDEIWTKLDASQSVSTQTEDYTFQLSLEDGTGLRAVIRKKPRDARGNHEVLTKDSIRTILQDLEDLGDWRNYKRLKTKLSD